MAKQLWRELVIDFGHELITAVHTPIAWSDRRPSDDEFRQSFDTTSLSVYRILEFAEKRRTAVRRLVMYNSEGYWMGAHMTHEQLVLLLLLELIVMGRTGISKVHHSAAGKKGIIKYIKSIKCDIRAGLRHKSNL